MGVKESASRTAAAVRTSGARAAEAAKAGYTEVSGGLRESPRARSIGGAARRALRTVTGLGWFVVVLGLVAWAVGAALGWRELLIIAGACLVVLLIGALFTLGGRKYRVALDLQPQRVVVGDEAAGEVTVVNESPGPALPCTLEVPIGASVAHVAVPALTGGGIHGELFLVPTNRRAVIPVGPASVVRGDPLGLFRREARMGEATVLYVHPRTVPVATNGSGLVRDLEGTPTQDLSTSDIAFHTLRDYVPGDDRRHIHWKTSARTGRLMVRQFQDTRRSHLLVLLSCRTGDYATPDEFELAVSAAASLALRSVRDRHSVTVLAGPQELPTQTPQRLLDGFSGLELADRSPAIRALTRRAGRHTHDVSLSIMIGGSGTDAADVRDADRWLPAAAPRVFLRASVGSTAGFAMAGGVRSLVIGELSHLNTGLSAVSAV